MTNAWVVRPKPHGYNRLDEFLDQGIVAIGWPDYGNLTGYSKDEIRALIEDRHDWSPQKTGQVVGMINRFINEIEDADYVLVPSGGNVYLGRIKSDYYFQEDVASDDEGYPHQREVEWLFEGNAINRSSLPGKIHDSLKGRLTVFSADADRVKDLSESELDIRGRDRYGELQEEYLKRLRQGELRGVHSASFEDVAVTVLENYFPNITRQSTTSDPEGDTDLKTDLPGGVTVRVQVKHFYPDEGQLPVSAVTQLEKSMTLGDNGIVVTSTKASKEAIDAANESDFQIDIIDGSEFVELIFENLEEFDPDELLVLGLRNQPPEIRI